MALKDCVAAVKEAVGTGADGEELKNDDALEMLSAVERRIKAIRLRDPLISYGQAAAKAAEDIEAAERKAAFIEKRARAINVLRKKARLAAYTEGQEVAAVRALNVGKEGGDLGAARGVDQDAQMLADGLIGPLMGRLRQAGLLTIFRQRDKGFDRDVARELRRIGGDKTQAETGNKLAAKVAEIVAPVQEMARKLQNDAGAYIEKIPGWIVRQSHDSYRIAHAAAFAERSGSIRERLGGRTKEDFRAWAEFIGPKLDDRTYTDVGIDPTDAGEVTKFLEQVWRNLVSGNHTKNSGGDWLGGFKGPGNLAKKASQERVLHFKTADDWFDYNERFGNASLFEAIMVGLKSSARNTALMRVWGTNPEMAFAADIEQLQRRARDRGDFKTHDKLGGWRLQAEMDAVTGNLNVAKGPTLAAWASGARALQSMTKLGGVVLSSFPDIWVQASALRHHGVGYLEGFANGVASIIRGRGRGWQREFGDYMAVGIDGALGSMLAEFNAMDGIAGKASKMMDLFFRANLLNYWTDSMKLGVGLMLSRNLVRNAGKSFDQLPEALARSLQRYGIQAEQWDAIRTQGLKDADGDKFVTSEGIADQKTAEALRAYFTDSVNEAMTIGGAREQAIRTFGLQRGTPMGEAVRLVMQFKTYPITFYNRHLRREFGRTGSVDGVGLAALIVGTTAMGYLSMTAKELVKGREPRKPEDAGGWAKLMSAAMAQGGGLGIYGDFLFGQYNRHGGGGLITLAGPTVGTIDEALRIYGGLKEGEDVGAEATKFGVGMIPGINIFYARMAMDYLVLWHMQEAMNPGWARRFEQRVKKDNAQTFWLSPAQTVREGSAFAGQ